MASTLQSKLQLKDGQTLLVLHAPEGSAQTLVQHLPNIEIVQAERAKASAVLFFVSSIADALQRLPEAIDRVGENGLVWLAYPKSGLGVQTDANRDRLWLALVPSGWRPVRQVAMDEVWSAIRFRPAAQAGK